MTISEWNKLNLRRGDEIVLERDGVTYYVRILSQTFVSEEDDSILVQYHTNFIKTSLTGLIHVKKYKYV
jgi:hypothetical protein